MIGGTGMNGVTLDWSSAEVSDGKLDVGLKGELPKGWKDSFDRTVALLPGGEWGEVALKKNRIRVADVAEGSEARLNHFLESVVFQANADHRGDDAQEPEKDENTDDEDKGEDESDGPDAEMTETFRSFAAEPSDERSQSEN